jgi:hypothetical protein
MNRFQISTGQEVDKDVEEKISKYLEGHCRSILIDLNSLDGQKVLERMGTRNILEEQLKLQIQQKVNG